MAKTVAPPMTPMMRQYWGIKEQYPDHIVLYHLGDFYEMFFEDAKIASQILDIALTSRNKQNENPIPMCGFPYHHCEEYIATLLKAGKKVVLCDQETIGKGSAPGLVKREVKQVLSAGIALEHQGIASGKPNYLVAVNGLTLVAADVSTGELLGTVLESEAELMDELFRLNPAEIVIEKEDEEKAFLSRMKSENPQLLISVCSADQFKGQTPDGVSPCPGTGTDISCLSPEEVRDGRGTDTLKEASNLLFSYLASAKLSDLSHMRPLHTYERKKHLILDEGARRNLELFETLRERKKEGSLFSVLDETQTVLGKRKLLKWLKAPLRNREEIERRLDAVDELIVKAGLRAELRRTLPSIRDLERLCSRIALGSGGAREMVTLRASLAIVPALKDLCRELHAEMFISLFADTLPDILSKLGCALVENPPFSVREGGMFEVGYSAELDELIGLSTHGKEAISQMEQAEREATGISSLKVRYNNVFGYSIEITKANLNCVPAHYERRQTLANGERYTTAALKELEEKILTAESKRCELEYALFLTLKEDITKAAPRIMVLAEEIALLDCLASFAEISARNRYVRPGICEEGGIEIQGGRHPVVEQMGSFVPNDVRLEPQENFLIITGPNMAGKSTFMRQIALIVIMAQMGCFVPADFARIELVDRIFTRIGASDELVSGKSTFMVEMTETATILREATHKSLILLDEIGRGTSAQDGFAIAWAVSEEILNHIKAKTLFATHYAELSEIAFSYPQARNFSVAVSRTGEKITFLHRVISGATNQSYGVEVAELAGIPARVIESARRFLTDRIVKEKRAPHPTDPAPSSQLSFI